MSQKTNNTEFITEFISIDKQHISLWKIKSAEYSNRNLKEKSYDALIEIYNKFKIVNATKDTVQKKIRSLRAAFRRELKKVKEGQKSGFGGEKAEEHQTSLWYYPLLLFTVEQEESRSSLNNMDMDMEDTLSEVN